MYRLAVSKKAIALVLKTDRNRETEYSINNSQLKNNPENT